jgi:4-amino-4-deoxy-L-arabinose transferase-like glycosyltransferase
VQIDMGPVSDSVVFLSNALVFAGQSTGYSNLLFPPIFPFIVSLFFRLGYVYTSTIFVVDGGLFVFGVIGLFLLFKIKFNNLESFVGGLLYATFPIVLTILGLGLSDLASVSFSIWAFYLTVLAVRNDSKYFYLAFPFIMLAFLTRYNSALIIFPILFYILFNKDKINIKNMSLGIGLSIITILPVLLFFYEKFGSIFSPFISFGSASTVATVSAQNPFYNPNIFFFLQYFPSFVGIQGSVILLIVIMGVLLYLFFKIVTELKNKKYKLNLINRGKITYIIFIILAIIFLGSFGKISYIFSELLFFVITYFFYELTKNKIKNLDIHLMFLAWFMTFFIFHSIFVIKDVRYFVVMAPAVAYFMILGLSEISNQIHYKIRNMDVIFPLLAILLTSIMLLSTASQIPLILQENHDNIVFNEQIQNASEWFVNYDPNYKNKNIYSDLGPNFSWYLKTNVKSVPVFHGNQTFLTGIINFSFDQLDSNKFNQYLESNNADYYFSVRQGLNLTSYYPIKQFGYLIIYKKN